jgi:uncharacterized Zn-binding protein involved in type VI secretion
MQIYAAVHGDITSSKPPARLVGTGTIPIEDVDGKMVNICVEGEHFHCPACNTTGVLISHGQGWPDNGKRIILHGDVAACACNPKPRVIATKQRLVSVTVEDASQRATESLAMSNLSTHIDEQNHEYFLVQRDDGTPAKLAYRIDSKNMKLYEGVLIEEGRTVAFPMNKSGEPTFWIPML